MRSMRELLATMAKEAVMRDDQEKAEAYLFAARQVSGAPLETLSEDGQNAIRQGIALAVGRMQEMLETV